MPTVGACSSGILIWSSTSATYEAELSGVAWVELGRPELNDNESHLLPMEEQEVHVRALTVHIEVNLPAHERELCTELAERLDNMLPEPFLEFALARVRVDCKEVEVIRVAIWSCRTARLQP